MNQDKTLLGQVQQLQQQQNSSLSAKFTASQLPQFNYLQIPLSSSNRYNKGSTIPVVSPAIAHDPRHQQTYSHHQAHHQFLDWQLEKDRHFNYSGSRLRSPNHDPKQLILRLQQGDSLKHSSRGNSRDQIQYDYNNINNNSEINEGSETMNRIRRTEMVRGNSSSLSSRRHDFLKQASKMSQPIGSGDYTNQLFLRTTASKTGVDFANLSGASTQRQTAISARTMTSADEQVGENSARNTATSQGLRQQQNNRSEAATLFRSQILSRRSQERLREKLYFDERTKTVPKTTIKNQIIDNIVSDSEVFMDNKPLMRSVFRLKSLNLLKPHQCQVNRFSGVGKFPFVFNDYHTKSTNNGFSRQEKGGFFFTK